MPPNGTSGWSARRKRRASRYALSPLHPLRLGWHAVAQKQLADLCKVRVQQRDCSVHPSPLTQASCTSRTDNPRRRGRSSHSRVSIHTGRCGEYRVPGQAGSTIKYHAVSFRPWLDSRRHYRRIYLPTNSGQLARSGAAFAGADDVPGWNSGGSGGIK